MVFLISFMSLFKMKLSCQLLSPGRTVIPLPQINMRGVKKEAEGNNLHYQV